MNIYDATAADTMPQTQPDGRWNAADYFRNLTEKNRLAKKYGFRFCVVSDLQGFEDVLSDTSMQSATAFVCVSDTSDGQMDLDNTPHITQVKTVFLAMRHSIQSGGARHRERAMAILREIFRQFMSHLSKEQVMVGEGDLYIDPRIRFSEISRYFYSGCACAYFQIGVTRWTSLVYNPSEWQ